MVGAEAEIVQHKIVVAHRGVAGDQPLTQRGVELGRGHNVGAHGHDARGDLGRHCWPVHRQQTIARQHRKARTHLALRGAGTHHIAAVQRRHGRTFKQTHARSLCGTRQTQRVFERVQMARTRFAHRRAITRAADVALHIVAFGPVDLDAFGRQKLGLFTQGPNLAGRIGNVHITRHPIALDLMLLHARLQQVHRLHRHVPSALRIGRAQLRFKRSLPAGKTHDGLATVAPTRARAHAVGLEHHHVQAFLGQIDRRRQTRKARPDHHHIGLQIVLQSWLRRGPLHAGLVVTALVELRVAAQQTGRTQHHGRAPWRLATSPLR